MAAAVDFITIKAGNGGKNAWRYGSAINGFGRIGRNVFRAAYESGADIEWLAVNDLVDPKTIAHLLKYDSNYGPFPGEVEATDAGFAVDGKEIRVLAERDPADLPWS